MGGEIDLEKCGKGAEGVPSSRIRELEKLCAFIGPKDKGFRTNAWEPMELLEEFIRGKLRTSGASNSSGPNELAGRRTPGAPADSS